MQITRSNSNQPLGKYFKASEFFPHSGQGTSFYLDNNLVSFLNALRERFGKPITITSGIRTVEQQTLLMLAGKTTATKSYHLKGQAADITASNFQSLVDCVNSSVDLFDQYGINGVNIYNNFIHVDTRDGERKTWGGPPSFIDGLSVTVPEEENNNFSPVFLLLLAAFFAFLLTPFLKSKRT